MNVGRLQAISKPNQCELIELDESIVLIWAIILWKIMMSASKEVVLEFDMSDSLVDETFKFLLGESLVFRTCHSEV